ncbi:MAG TPA: response regulator [Rhodanobacteraceae bacterium]|nr:response regulator [Rhodanobacteraceae bacterium]
MPHALVADDNPLSLRFFADALATLGIDCVAVADGNAAVAHAGARRFDLLLLDARMPGLTGTDALSLIRTGTGKSRTAIALATTAADDANARADLLRAGFAEVLPKPLPLQTLCAAITRHIARAPPRDDDPVASPAAVGEGGLDDSRALSAAGGDSNIVDALRALLAAELAGLPAEFARHAQRRDQAAIEARLHRLDASAGFCGASRLARAIDTLRTALARSEPWPTGAVADFLGVCETVRIALDP